MPQLQDAPGASRLRLDENLDKNLDGNIDGNLNGNAASTAPHDGAEAPMPEETEKRPPIRTLRDIPGLGPIRVRALQKAGLTNLTLLGEANRERLLAVPGMSTIKADYILGFLDSARSEGRFLPIETHPIETHPIEIFPIESRSEVDSVEGTDKISDKSDTILLSALEGTHAPQSSMTEATREIGSISGADDWSTEAARLRADTIRLLTCHAAPDYRTRLLRELVRFASGMLTWHDALARTKDEKLRERSLRRVRRLQSLVTEMLTHPELDRKKQARLADELEEATDRLYALSGQTEPSRLSSREREDTGSDGKENLTNDAMAVANATNIANLTMNKMNKKMDRKEDDNE